MAGGETSRVRAEQHRRSATTTERGLTQFIAGDAWFCAIGLVVGLLIGVAAWRWLRDLGWSVVLVVLVCATASALTCWLVGYRLGPGDFSARLAAAQPGELVPIPLTLRARASLLTWPFFAIIPCCWAPPSAAMTRSHGPCFAGGSGQVTSRNRAVTADGYQEHHEKAAPQQQGDDPGGDAGQGAPIQRVAAATVEELNRHQAQTTSQSAGTVQLVAPWDGSRSTRAAIPPRASAGTSR